MSEDEKDNLLSIKWNDIAEFLPKLETSLLTSEIGVYLKKSNVKFGGIEDIIILTKNVLDGYQYFNKSTTLTDLLFGYLILKFQDDIYSIFNGKELQLSNYPLTYSVCQEGIIYGAITMIELSNTLKEPLVVSSNAGSNIEQSSVKFRTPEQILIERVTGYGYYVEAKITLAHHVKLYLHRVIDTKGGARKSTLFESSFTFSFENLYDSVWDVLWNTAQEHQSFDNCTSSTSIQNHYHIFKLKVQGFLEEMASIFLTTLAQQNSSSHLEIVR